MGPICPSTYGRRGFKADKSGLDPLVCNNYHKSLAKEECFLKELISGSNDHVKAYTIGTEDSIVIGKLIMEIEDDNTANMDILIGERYTSERVMEKMH